MTSRKKNIDKVFVGEGTSLPPDAILTSNWDEAAELAVRESGTMNHEQYATKYEGIHEFLGRGHFAEGEWFLDDKMEYEYYFRLCVRDESQVSLFHTRDYDALLFAKYALQFLLTGNRTYVGEARKIDIPIEKIIKKMRYPDHDRYFDNLVRDFHRYFIERLSIC